MWTQPFTAMKTIKLLQALSMNLYCLPRKQMYALMVRIKESSQGGVTQKNGNISGEWDTQRA